MMQAIKEFHLQTSSASEQKLTLRAIARAYDVPFETLRRRSRASSPQIGHLLSFTNINLARRQFFLQLPKKN